MTVPETLINECKKFNKWAQKELYEMYVPLFKGLCRRYADNEEDAKDIMQEGFIKIFSKIKQYKGKGSFEGWMKRIMINTAISFYHKKKAKNELSIFDNHERQYNVEEQHDSISKKMELDKTDINEGNFGFDMVTGADFTYEELFNMLGQLPKPFRDVFNLHCIEGYKHKEIAKILSIDEKTSRTRLLRARGQLQKVLFKQCVEKIGR